MLTIYIMDVSSTKFYIDMAFGGLHIRRQAI